MIDFFKSKRSNCLENAPPRSKLHHLVDAVDAIFTTQSDKSDYNIFESIVHRIHLLTGAVTVIAGRYDHAKEEVVTCGFWNQGKICEGISYSIKDTPSESVIGKEPHSYPSKVAELFPLDTILAENHIQAYVGIPLFYTENRPMGLVAALFDCDLEDSREIEAVLRIFGIRIASEMEHMEYHEILEAQNNELISLFNELKEKNRELDKYIAELEKARKETEESNQLKTAFLANLSHEIRTPMNVMLGFSELLKTEHLTREEKMEFIDIINQNGMQLLKIMDNLIEISKFQTHIRNENPTPVFINQIIDRFSKEYLEYIKIAQKPLSLLIEKGVSDKNDLIVADQDGISKVLDQLMDNAIKFTFTGSIRLGYSINQSHIKFFVEDTGIGIPEDMSEKIFDMFRQVDLRTSREFGGNGLGLAIARKYAETMGGRIYHENNPSGIGTTFFFEIPLKVS